jgi:hypothetical protein
MLLALLLLLTESVVKVPASHWTAIELKIEHNGTTVHAGFEVRNGAKVQALVLSRDEAERLNRGRSVRSLFSSGFTTSDQFRVRVPDAGDYVLLLDNRLEERFPAEVALRLELTHTNDSQVRYVPAARRHATVALSLLFFGVVVVFSAVKFLRT